MDNLAWAFVWGLAGVVVAVSLVVLLARARRRKRETRELARHARQLKTLRAEATHDLVRRLTDDQDLDRWWAEYEDWCRRVGDKLAEHFSIADRERFDAGHEPPLEMLAQSQTPRRDAFRSHLAEKVARLEHVIERHL